MLGDAAGLPGRHVGGAHGVKERRLAVVHVAHHRHHRGPGDETGIVVLIALESDLDIGLADALDVVAELFHDQLGRIGVDLLVGGSHDVHLHQRPDDVGAAFGHAVGQILHCDGLGYDNVANDFQALSRGLQLLLFLSFLFAGAPD